MCIVQVMKEDRQRDGASVSSSMRKEPKTFAVAVLHRISNILYILLCPSVTLLLIIVNTGIIMRHLTPPEQYLICLKIPIGTISTISIKAVV